ncbi:hypothetical protein JHK82_054341 [Glycine max]|nr:hypothetical protein JHK86_054185 [Glycine max]KAG4916689.1 hypothetical protein JHK87_054246 [Glycine soja]KAG4928659.1 hypothetical protein JHK85_055145 [Glycine max]KAG5086944.1 hypothetical protein JHK82_054341 [Glycine max]KHN43454.1 hypothetical protein glysoja_002037 [Glycine soja]
MEEKKRGKMQILNLTTNLQCAKRPSSSSASEQSFAYNNLKSTKKNQSVMRTNFSRKHC